MIIFQIVLLVVTGIYIIYKDLKERIIPNKVNLVILIGGGLVCLWHYQNVLDHILGFLLLGGLMLLLAIVTKGFGYGDVKYMFAVGLLLGLKQGFYALMIGFILGGMISLILLLLKKVDKKDHIAFGPYLVLGSILSFLV